MPQEVERTPVQAPGAQQQSLPAMEIVPVMKPIQLTDFMPKVGYQIQGATISTDAQQVKEALYAFLELNQEVIPNGANTTDPNDLEQFTKGYRNAIAMVELWIDSQYVTGTTE